MANPIEMASKFPPSFVGRSVPGQSPTGPKARSSSYGVGIGDSVKKLLSKPIGELNNTEAVTNLPVGALEARTCLICLRSSESAWDRHC